MICRVTDFRNKEVVNVKTGEKYGPVNDVEIDTENANLKAIVIFGKLRLFGLLGRQEDCVVDWHNIKLIGDEIILVDCDAPYRAHSSAHPLRLSRERFNFKEKMLAYRYLL